MKDYIRYAVSMAIAAWLTDKIMKITEPKDENIRR